VQVPRPAHLLVGHRGRAVAWLAFIPEPSRPPPTISWARWTRDPRLFPRFDVW